MFRLGDYGIMADGNLKINDARITSIARGGLKPTYWNRFALDMSKNWKLYILFSPVLVYYLIFCYGPMYGVIIAFKDFNPSKGILGSNWIGFYHFYDFLTSTDIKRIVFNTFNISLTGLIAGFPAPIILALLLNEIRSRTWKRTVQTISYMPHFISVVVICGMIRSFVSDTGIVTWLLHIVGLSDKIDLLGKKDLFVPIYVTSGIWQEIGWGSIIYLAALTGISQELYEAAEIDGAGRWRQLLAVTLPGIIPTIVILLILRMGSIMSVGFEKIILLYNPLTYETADVISSYTYRRGLMEFNYSYSTAVGLLNSLINFVLLISANTISKKVNNTSMW